MSTDTTVSISLLGPNLKRLKSWERVHKKLLREISGFLHERKIVLTEVTLCIQDAKVISGYGNVILSVRQGGSATYYPEKVEEVIRKVLQKNLPPTAKLTNS